MLNCTRPVTTVPKIDVDTVYDPPLRSIAGGGFLAFPPAIAVATPTVSAIAAQHNNRIRSLITEPRSPSHGHRTVTGGTLCPSRPHVEAGWPQPGLRRGEAHR